MKSELIGLLDEVDLRREAISAPSARSMNLGLPANFSIAIPVGAADEKLDVIHALSHALATEIN
ncbi:MAG: hypothetical protein R3C56_02765 [Pirellulaceae bacterium]